MYKFKLDTKRRVLEWTLNDEYNPKYAIAEHDISLHTIRMFVDYLESPTFQDSEDQQYFMTTMATLFDSGGLGSEIVAPMLYQELRTLPIEFFRNLIDGYWKTKVDSANSFLKAMGQNENNV